MTRRQSFRASDIKTILCALQKSGLSPTAMDTMPDGTVRWHFTPTSQNEQNDLERELAEFERRHGHS